MTALILSGGGALGAFQVGALKYAREVKGYRWDLIAGVSIGAMNGAMLAMGKHERLYQIWENEIDNKLVYGPLGRVPTGLLGLRSLYFNRWRRRLVRSELQGQFLVPLKVGTVSLITGEYKIFTEQNFQQDPYSLEAVLASGSMPIAWPPADVGPNDPEMVDGGIRNTSPIGDVLKEKPEPDEIVIINCLPRDPGRLAKPPCTIVDIGIRFYDVLMNEIFVEDVKEFVWINKLVKEAKDGGVVLHHPDDGRELRSVAYKIIEPDSSLGDGGDFSRERTLERLAKGREKAKEVLG